jgi:hypothetical protein
MKSFQDYLAETPVNQGPGRRKVVIDALGRYKVEEPNWAPDPDEKQISGELTAAAHTATDDAFATMLQSRDKKGDPKHDVHALNGSPLGKTIEKGSVNKLRELLFGSGANPDFPNGLPLAKAVYRMDSSPNDGLEMIALLLDAGADAGGDPDKGLSSKSNTPLQIAMYLAGRGNKLGMDAVVMLLVGRMGNPGANPAKVSIVDLANYIFQVKKLEGSPSHQTFTWRKVEDEVIDAVKNHFPSAAKELKAAIDAHSNSPDELDAHTKHEKDEAQRRTAELRRKAKKK